MRMAVCHPNREHAAHGLCASCLTKKWNKEHPERQKKHLQKWRETHKDETDAYQKAYRETHKDERSEYASTYCKTHRDKIAARSRAWRSTRLERLSARTRQWRIANPEAAREIDAKRNHHRRIRENNAPVTLTNTEWQEILEQYGNRCLCCGKKFDQLFRPTIDHIVPVIDGGGLTKDNVQPLCKSCNSKKGARTIDYRSL